MDVATIDNEFSQLQVETQQATQAISDLAQKMQAAGQAGDANAKEWILDLKSIALQIQQEQLQTQSLLQALHNFTVNQMQEPPVQQYQAPPPQYQQAQYEPPQQQYQQQYQQQPRGGTLSRFMGGGFGQSMTSGLGMGAGFGLADSVINAIFH